ncbi:MAG: archease [Thermoplasmata archaeon]
MDHTADVGIHAYGEDLEEVFEETARGMFSIITDLSHVESKDHREIELESDNLESLLVNFLSELIYLHEVYNELYAEFDVEIEEKDKIILRAKVDGEKIDLERHVMDTAVKAVSYHELRIDPDGDVEIIFDI